MGYLLRRAKRVLRGKLARLLDEGPAECGAGPTPAFEPDVEDESPAADASAAGSTEDDTRARAFAVLEVAPGVTREELRSAYLRLCRRYHPDRFDHDAQKGRAANELLAEINAAYELLTSAS